MTFVRPLAVLVAGCLLAGPARAETIQKSETVASGKTARLLLVPNLKKDCSEGPMPEFRFSGAPKNGVLITKSAKQKTPGSYRCPNKDTFVQAVFYQPKDGFKGADEVTFEVRNSDAQIQTYAFKITVDGGSGTSGSDQNKTGTDAKKENTDL